MWWSLKPVFDLLWGQDLSEWDPAVGLVVLAAAAAAVWIVFSTIYDHFVAYPLKLALFLVILVVLAATTLKPKYRRHLGCDHDLDQALSALNVTLTHAYRHAKATAKASLKSHLNNM